MVLTLLIATVLAPALVAGAVAAAARLLPESSPARRASTVVALALGYVAAHLATLGAPSFPPVDTTAGLFYLALLAAALGIVIVLAGAGGRRVTWVVLVALTLALTLHPLLRHQWSARAAAIRVPALAVAALASTAAYQAIGARVAIASARAAWIVAIGGAAALLLFARTALLGQLAGAIAVALAVVTAVGLARGGASAVASDAVGVALPFLAPMLHALVLNGFFYAELGGLAAVMLTVAPLAAAVDLALRRRGPWLRAAAAALAVAIVLAPFVARAGIGYAADDRGYSETDE